MTLSPFSISKANILDVNSTSRWAFNFSASDLVTFTSFTPEASTACFTVCAATASASGRDAETCGFFSTTKTGSLTALGGGAVTDT